MKAYPKWKYHSTKPAVIVQDADEEAALGRDWSDRPAPPDAEPPAPPPEPPAPKPQEDDLHLMQRMPPSKKEELPHHKPQHHKGKSHDSTRRHR